MTPVREPYGGAGGAYYRRLEVGPGASHDEIVRAYRRLALGVHPDAHPEDPEAPMRFREITEAYEVLGDPVRRRAYDGSGGDRHIPALRGRADWDPAFMSSEEMTTAESRAADPPTVLGASTPRLPGEAPLRVGPVRIGPSPGTDEETGGVAAWLLEILDSWWRR